MNCYYRLFKGKPSKESGYAPELFLGAFLFVGELGDVQCASDFIKDHVVTPKDDITFKLDFIEALKPQNAPCASLFVIFSKEQTIKFFENFILKASYQGVPPQTYGLGVSVDLSCLLREKVSAYRVFQALDNGHLHDLFLRNLLLKVARGQPVGSESQLLLDELKAYYEVRNRAMLEELGFYNKESLESVKSKRLLVKNSLLALREISLKQDIESSRIENNLGVNILVGEKDRLKFDFSFWLLRCRGLFCDIGKLKELKKSLRPLILKSDRLMVSEGFAREDTTKKTPTININKSLIVSRLQAEGIARLSAKGNVLTRQFDYKRSTSEALNYYGETISSRLILRDNIPAILKEVTSRSTLHPKYFSFGLTGRASASKPNIMGLPSSGGLRECFRARKGHIFLIADFDSVEMRVFGQVLLDVVGKSQLAEWYKRDSTYDPHSFLASHYLGIDYNEALRLKFIEDAEFKKVRSKMKAVNFGFMGGASPETIAQHLQEDMGGDIQIKEANELQSLYFKTFPEVEDYFSIIKSKLSVNGYAPAYINRCKRVIGNRDFTQLLNNHVQALASDGSMEALYRITKYGFAEFSALHKSRPVLSIHDEIIVEVKEEIASNCAYDIHYHMTSAMNSFTPDVPSAVEVRKSKVWRKGGEVITIGVNAF